MEGLGHLRDRPRASGVPRPSRRLPRSRPAAVDAFWQAGVDAGYRSDGAPGPRAAYHPDYYGAFLLDPDGNSVEALSGEPELRAPAGGIDHLWIRVRDLDASRRFYATIAPQAGLRLGDDEPGRVQFRGDGHSFSLIDDERPPTEHVHIAFGTDQDADVREFHAAAIAAGYEDNGGPGERLEYHPGYYGAFVLDPDGNNVEVVNHNLEMKSSSSSQMPTVMLLPSPCVSRACSRLTWTSGPVSFTVWPGKVERPDRHWMSGDRGVLAAGQVRRCRRKGPAGRAWRSAPSGRSGRRRREPPR